MAKDIRHYMTSYEKEKSKTTLLRKVQTLGTVREALTIKKNFNFYKSQNLLQKVLKVLVQYFRYLNSSN